MKNRTRHELLYYYDNEGVPCFLDVTLIDHHIMENETSLVVLAGVCGKPGTENTLSFSYYPNGLAAFEQCIGDIKQHYKLIQDADMPEYSLSMLLAVSDGMPDIPSIVQNTLGLTGNGYISEVCSEEEEEEERPEKFSFKLKLIHPETACEAIRNALSVASDPPLEIVSFSFKEVATGGGTQEEMKEAPPEKLERNWLTIPFIASLATGLIIYTIKIVIFPKGMRTMLKADRGYVALYIFVPWLIASIVRYMFSSPQAKREAGIITFWIVLALLTLIHLFILLG